MRKLSFISILCLLFLLLHYGCERETNTVDYGNGVPPAVPKGVKLVYASDGEVLIAWTINVERDLDAYLIYRSVNDTMNFSLLGKTYKSYFYDDSLSYDSVYYYRVSAINRNGNESRTSEIVWGKPENSYPPGKVTDLSVNGRNWESKIYFYLTWTPRYESDVAGYWIYRDEKEDFLADSSTYIGFTSNFSFNDTNSIGFYKKYYYKIKAIDKGGLLGVESNVNSDLVLEIPEIVFPLDKSFLNYFDFFQIVTVNMPATYRIIVQTNEHFGEIWNKDIYSTAITEKLFIPFTASYIQPYKDYYWRVVTFNQGKINPNSISPLYTFRIKP